ncbi:MAG: protein adenylyltransferase SelO [Pseudomonadota bacterium]
MNDLRTLDRLVFDNTWLQLPDTLWARVQPQGISNPRLLSFNAQAAALIELDPSVAQDPRFLAVAAGRTLLPGMDPVAQKYTGHQFGVYNPDLGDGRGLLLGEVRTSRGSKWDLHLKGAGTTPFSRGADGRAVLRSTIREYLCSEAMHGLGIPTTRGLCIVAGTDPVIREETETSATLIRMAETHIRFGHFEYLYYTQQREALAGLADHVIGQHFPQYGNRDDRHALLLRDVIARTARMIAAWQAEGFNHGVMNTDNMSILGLTFDYGPYAFFDEYDARFVCNHTDHAGRYAFHRQPGIGLWNLNALAHAFSGLLAREQLVELLQGYEGILVTAWRQRMLAKLGLRTEKSGDERLLEELLDLLQASAADYPRFFRRLCSFRTGDRNDALRDDIVDRERFDAWAQRYADRLGQEQSADDERETRMKRSNPKYVLRNWVAQTAIDAAKRGDDSVVNDVLRLVQNPYEEWAGFERYAAPPPDWGRRMEISCSS